jgi:hypothetical protein
VKRFSQDDEQASTDTGTPVVAETFRSAAQSAQPPAKSEDEKMSLFWRVFGGTILSIAALVAITVFNNIQSSINDLRGEATRAREALASVVKREDLDREREARTGLAKKEDVDARIKTQYERIRAIEAYKVDIEAAKERAHSAAAAVENLKKELAASVDMLKRDTATIELFRERLTVLTGESKLASEAVNRMQSELEKNKASDLERKLFRDAQAKTIDDTMRELQRAVQDCREKLARLEGAGPAPRNPPRPTEPKTGD